MAPITIRVKIATTASGLPEADDVSGGGKIIGFTVKKLAYYLFGEIVSK
ncbi:MAG: hypothetical protein HYX61_05105 [Gammaproteobacteria bacterium]|jgi:hypothetical protein|nr:hypothetical protein [Gammaproteobacteria bacterium]